MRGLTELWPGPARSTLRAVTAAAAALTAFALLVSACGSSGTGARDEGPAGSDSVAGAAASPSMMAPSVTPERVDAVRLVKADPLVSAAVKRDLKPCAADEYPIDVSYGELTGGTASDVVVNVLTCGDAVGVGSYVYREADGGYLNVFRAEEPPVYAEIDRGDLVVTKQVYERGDPVSNPSGENVITYHWTGGRFVERYRTHNEYGTVAGEPTPVPGDT
ncbi:hypothetical protein [Streptomyces sp. B93]|uniref:hypothetical protein n=1 Tax=Streptomyces sp. B93 TaxID=2824875 RepID=UPI001B35E854|nr:hypothetical protein [Streptomyces sp. B93]MBQ1093273.1 hypothetical protein [Streptomyces sp. B93]